MVKWNEKQASQQIQNLKTAVIKLASLEKRTVKNDQEVVFLKGEQKDEVFTNFIAVWKKQGISLDSLNYGDELLVRWKPHEMPDGRVFKNFVEVFQKKQVSLAQLTHSALEQKDLDRWDPQEEDCSQDVDMSEWDTGDEL